MEAAVVPLPIPEITPPDTKMYFVEMLAGTINYIKSLLNRQLFFMSGVRSSFARASDGQEIEQFSTHFLSGRPDLNRRPFPWEGNILPLNYCRRYSQQ